MVTWTGQFPASFLAVATALFEDQPGAEGFSRVFPVETVLDKGVIPFAEDVGGDLFCFSFREDHDSPPVAFWSVDTGAVRLADDFDAFVGMLRE